MRYGCGDVLAKKGDVLEEETKHKLGAIRLIGFLVIAFFALLGLIHSSSDAREMEVVLEILHGDWLLPLRVDSYIPSKPLLYHYLCALVLKIWSLFGAINLLTLHSVCRLVSLVACLGIVMATHKLCREIFAKVSLKFSLDDSLALTVALLCSYLLTRLGISMMVDAVFCACCSFAYLFGFRIAIGNKDPRNKFRLILSLALATLSKGYLGGIVTSLVLVPTFVYECGLKGSRPEVLRFIALVAGGLAAGSVWYLVGSIEAYQTGRFVDFINRHFWFENVSRFVGHAKTNSQPSYYYLVSYLRSFFPFSLLFAYLIFKVIKIREYREKISPLYPLFGGLALVLLFFTAASGKRHTYLGVIIPIFSSLLIVLGATVRLRKVGGEDVVFNKWMVDYLTIMPEVGRYGLVLVSAIFSFFLLVSFMGGGFFTPWYPERWLPLILLSVLICGLVYGYPRLLEYIKSGQESRESEVMVYTIIFAAVIYGGACLNGALKAAQSPHFRAGLELANEEEIMVSRPKYKEFLDVTIFYTKILAYPKRIKWRVGNSCGRISGVFVDYREHKELPLTKSIEGSGAKSKVFIYDCQKVNPKSSL